MTMIEINTNKESPKGSSYLNLKTAAIAATSLGILGGLYAASHLGMLDGLLDGLKDKVLSFFSSSILGRGGNVVQAVVNSDEKVASDLAEILQDGTVDDVTIKANQVFIDTSAAPLEKIFKFTSTQNLSQG